MRSEMAGPGKARLLSMNSPSDYRPDSYSFPALPSIVAAERVLQGVLENHVLVGGACVGFYVDDPGAAEVRPTDDVDAVVEIRTEVERVQLDERLRAAGARPTIFILPQNMEISCLSA